MSRQNNHEEPQPELENIINYTGNKGPTFGTRHTQVLAMAITSAIVFVSNSSLNTLIVSMTDSQSSNPNVPTYNWSNQSVILSSIMWSGIPFYLLAGYLGKQYGPKWIVSISGILNSICFLLIPLSAAHGGATGVIVCRIFQGIALGFFSPMGTVMSGRWVPPEERARMGYLGGGLITVLLSLVSMFSIGYITQSSLGWPLFFYIYGALGLLVSVLYALIGVQSPEVHKRITPEEKKYLRETLFQTDDDKNKKTPWMQIFTSMAFWAAVVGQAGSSWITTIMQTETNIFLAAVMQFDVKTLGFIAAAPILVGIIAGTGVSILSDHVVKRKIISVRNSRRLFQTIGVTGMALALIFLTFMPVEHRKWTVVILCIGDVFVMGFAIGGAGLSILDISPKYAGIAGAVSGMLTQGVSLFAPLTVQWIVDMPPTDASQWRTVFLVSGAIAVSTAIFFDIFASGKRQNWDGETEREANIEMRRRKSSIISFSTGIGIGI